ncbi:PP2C family protein-serine/threonine phosphatase [Quadrisphaera oryzae]|uniref:PP2C family protein-serine/threonine phosphatase n=1 Tax=Quadrisphaera TaxID=317661 RepID=UPI00164967F0|nr:protein phosphatase 2C domain-containing protein [Quadrisphaera sp. RL12-1S]MBC3762010.1 serine/threonine-protein phosphatase [Quadrisphaera sp. RL12-1S]
MPLAVVTGARSDRGTVRPHNEDSGYAGRRLALVADGVGGSAAGDVASAIVIGELLPLDDRDDELHPGEDPASALGAAITRAQDALLEHVVHHPETAGMGTTLTALMATDDDVVLAHIGDSRAYRRPLGGALQQVTRDDTYVQQLVDQGVLTPEQADSHPMGNIITACLGTAGSHSTPVLSRHAAHAGDRWLLCSDGLSGVLSVETMQQVMDEEPSAWVCSLRLVELALRAGATDNVTCVVVAVVQDDQVLPFPPRLVGAAADGADADGYGQHL